MHKSDGNRKAGEIVRLLWKPSMIFDLHTPLNLECNNGGMCNLTACLSESEIALLKQLVSLPLQLDYSPFPTDLVKVLYLDLFGDEIEIIDTD